MSSRTPTLLIFMTAAGHYGCRTIYRATLDHLDRQLPLVQWSARVAHIKARPGEEPVMEIMKDDLQRRGFIVETAVGDWVRGQSHYAAYLRDQIRMSQHPAVYDNPLVYWTDDDYLAVTHQGSFERVLARMCQLVESDPNVLTARFLREEDVDALNPDRTVAIEPELNLAWSKHLNFQPLVVRSRDFHRACKIIEDNWTTAVQMHGEALWREVLAPFSRSERKHAVWLPTYSQVVNLGVLHYLDVAKRLNLTISPNPVA